MNSEASVQAILNQHLSNYQQHHTLTMQQDKVCRQLKNCRTPVMGGQYVKCDQCEFEQVRYYSCRNRHCPQCQQRATQEWCDKQTQVLLPENYFHLVFTLPHELNQCIKQNSALIYRLLFQSAWQTIKQFGADKKRLDGLMGMTAVLHTWGQNLSQHVHLHCLIPGGALSQDKKHWHRVKGEYLFPVRALSRHFRGKMVSALRQASQPSELYLSGTLNHLLDELMKKDWVIYAKHTLNKTESVVRYLARYTHKAAISNSRIIAVDDSNVQFRWKDYRDEQKKTMTLSGEEFIRRYLLHVLPKGFMRIRHVGFLANRCRRAKEDCIRRKLQDEESTPTAVEPSANNNAGSSTGEKSVICPKCRQGRLVLLYEVGASYRQKTIDT